MKQNAYNILHGYLMMEGEAEWAATAKKASSDAIKAVKKTKLMNNLKRSGKVVGAGLALTGGVLAARALKKRREKKAADAAAVS
jgi:hypothetical protein